jgi:transposase InsO family protein
MPWQTITPLDEITRFVSLAQTDRFIFSDLCEQFGISRKTGYKHMARHALDGLKGLQPRSHRPHSCPHRTDVDIEKLILAERRLHRTWGPRKLQVVLQLKHGIENPPAHSTISEILRRNAMSAPRRRNPGAYSALNDGLTVPTQPNHVWTVDFKGCFNLGNSQRCDPLTVCDRYSHYILACRAQPNQQYENTLRTFKKLMRQAGLPEIIRCDLGSPFASNGLGRLSSLSIWWIDQGIQVEFMHPASPQENGSHERMHRDLKAEVASTPSANLAAQQRRFERWRHEYNHHRPHESLCMQTPAQFYQPSVRRLNEHDRPVCYGRDYETKNVSSSGHVSHEGKNYQVGAAFAGKPVGLRRDDAGQTGIYYANVLLGRLVYDPQRKSLGASATYIEPACPERRGADRPPAPPRTIPARGEAKPPPP